MKQDGELRVAGKWHFTLYDALDRVAVEGVGGVSDISSIPSSTVVATYGGTGGFLGTGYAVITGNQYHY